VGSVGKGLLNVSDSLLNQLKVVDKKANPERSALSKVPVLRGLAVSPYASSQYVEDFYDNYKKIVDEASDIRSSGQEYPEEFDEKYTYSNKMNKYMGYLNSQVKVIRYSNESSKVKKELLLEMQSLQDILAKKFIASEELTNEEESVLKALKPVD